MFLLEMQHGPASTGNPLAAVMPEVVGNDIDLLEIGFANSIGATTILDVYSGFIANQRIIPYASV